MWSSPPAPKPVIVMVSGAFLAASITSLSVLNGLSAFTAQTL